tara:strand:+ start:500 stop:676 length:177 start_codon:yes stop_codon:yes gene_type:complete
LAISQLLNEYQEILISAQYHLSNYSVSGLDDCIYQGFGWPDNCYTPRGQFYGITVVPT